MCLNTILDKQKLLNQTDKKLEEFKLKSNKIKLSLK